MPGSDSIDAVLPLAPPDFERAKILFASLCHFSTPLGTLWVVTPDEAAGEAARIVPAGIEHRILGESQLIPEVEEMADPPSGWFVQQLVKLAIAKHVATDFYLTLDADVVCARRFTVDELIRDGRAVSNRREGPRFEPDWYDWAARVLGLPGSRFVHGVTPAMLSRTAVIDLQGYLGERAGRGRTWRRYLLDSVPWTEYVLYFTWLEAEGRYDEFHFPGGHGADTIYGNSLWLPEQDLASWDAEKAFGGGVPYQFVVIQSNHPHITTDDVAARVGPFIGLAD
jgi:hypothetical protein